MNSVWWHQEHVACAGLSFSLVLVICWTQLKNDFYLQKNLYMDKKYHLSNKVKKNGQFQEDFLQLSKTVALVIVGSLSIEFY